MLRLLAFDLYIYAMNCTYEFGEYSEDGKREARCSRCGDYRRVPRSSEDRIHNKFCDGIPKSWEIGGLLTTALEVFYITPELWSRVKQKFGLSPACDCRQREATLNRMGSTVSSNLSRAYCVTSGLALR